MNKYTISYELNSGIISTICSNNVNMRAMYQDMSDSEYYSTMGELNHHEMIDVTKYKVENGKLVKLTHNESEYLRKYHRIPTWEDLKIERLLPTTIEIERAERDIEMIELIRSVMTNE